MNYKKGFTLIELLAVILILGIIALIAIPTVTNILSESKKASLKETAQTIVNTIGDQCNKSTLTDETITNSYYISGGTPVPAIDVKGKLPTDGVANVSSTCDVEIVVTSGNYCAIKDYGNDSVAIGTVNGDNCVLSNGTSIESPITTTPSSCFIYTEAGAITGYHFEDAGCPNEINVPDQINGTTITSIADGAFISHYDYILYGNDYTGVMDTSNNYDFYVSNFEATYGFPLEIDYVVPVSNADAIQKECYANPSATAVIKPINYELTGSDGFTYCTVDYDEAFENTIVYSTNITSVNLGNAKHLTSIGKAAFFGNSIGSVLFGSIPLQNIGASAFEHNSISRTLYLDKLPQLTDIGGYAFSDNIIESVTLPNSLEKLNTGAFYINSINSINFNNGTDYIGKWAFEDNNLSNLTLSNTTTYIDSYAFYDNTITAVTIPDSVQELGRNVFTHNNISTLKLGSSLQTIGTEAFNTAGTITNVTIPNSVTTIGIGAFAHSGVVNLNLGTGVKTISNWAFYDNKITSLVIPNSVTFLDHDSFYTNKITSLTIGSGLTSLPTRAFTSNLLTTVNIPSTITTIAADSFSINPTLTTINVNKATNSITNSPWGATGATVNWLG